MGLTLPKLSQKTLIYTGVIVAGIVGISIYNKGVSGVAKSVTQAGVNIGAGIVAGAVVGVSSVFGIPEVNADQCAKDMANGDNWGASKSCDVKTFAAWQAAGIKSNLDKLGSLLGL